MWQLSMNCTYVVISLKMANYNVVHVCVHTLMPNLLSWVFSTFFRNFLGGGCFYIPLAVLRSFSIKKISSTSSQMICVPTDSLAHLYEQI